MFYSDKTKLLYPARLLLDNYDESNSFLFQTVLPWISSNTNPGGQHGLPLQMHFSERNHSQRHAHFQDFEDVWLNHQILLQKAWASTHSYHWCTVLRVPLRLGWAVEMIALWFNWTGWFTTLKGQVGSEEQTCGGGWGCRLWVGHL